MSYRIDADRAHDILCCLTPLRIVMNSPEFVDGKKFADTFKSDGFSVLSVGNLAREDRKTQILRIQKIWGPCSVEPVIVEGNFSMDDIFDLFPGVYSYVYLYPNSAKSYAKMIYETMQTIEPCDRIEPEDLQEIARLFAAKDPKWKKKLEEFTKTRIEANRVEYENQCCSFDDKIFTVLI
jgi:hypothetical protein